MNLQSKLKLINDMIKENPDATIRDYLTLVSDIENIEKSTPMAFPGIGQDKKEEILKMAATMTATEIRQETNIAFSTIYRVLRQHGIDVKAETRQRKLAERIAKEEMERKEREAIIAARKPKKPILPERPFTRPPAVYSNHSPFGIAS